MELDLQAYIDKAIEEILKPTLESSKEYLEVYKVEIENGMPRIARVDLTFSLNLVAVFFPIINERFFIELHLTKVPEIKVDSVNIQNAHRVYFTATSKVKSFLELSSHINQLPVKGWSVGERENFKGKDHDHSRIIYEPIENEAYGLNEKLELLLNDLEKNYQGILELTQNSNAYISVCKYQNLATNAGIKLDIELIKRLGKLNLGLDMDIYIVGKELYS